MKEVHKENYSVDVGSGSLGEEFELKLIGLKKGDKTLYEVEFPAGYPNPILAGKKVEFKVDVKGVKKRIRPEQVLLLEEGLIKFITIEDPCSHRKSSTEDCTNW